MSTEFFTPGPWEAFYNEHGGYDMMWPGIDVRQANEEVRAIVTLEYGKAPDDERLRRIWADASLIAAAPEMFEALKAVLHAKIIYTGGGDDESIAECGMELVAPIKAQIEAALAKASGAVKQ